MDEKPKKQAQDAPKPPEFEPGKSAKYEGEDGDFNGGTPHLIGRPVRLKTVDDARRLLSRLILEFQRGTIDDKKSKCLCYLVVSYVDVATQTDFEDRIKALEEKTGKKQ